MAKKHPKTRKVRVEVTIPTMGYKGTMMVPMTASSSSVSKRAILKSRSLISLIIRGPITTSSHAGPCGEKSRVIKTCKIYGK